MIGASSGMKGFFLSGATYDVGVMVLFLFQMVFMDTALTIVTGAAAERWKYAAFCVSSLVLGSVDLSVLRQLGLGRRLAFQAGRELRVGRGLCGFCRIGGGALGRRNDCVSLGA